MPATVESEKDVVLDVSFGQEDKNLAGGEVLIQKVKYKTTKDLVDVNNRPNDYGIFRCKIAKVVAFYVNTTTMCPKLNDHMHNSLEKS